MALGRHVGCTDAGPMRLLALVVAVLLPAPAAVAARPTISELARLPAPQRAATLKNLTRSDMRLMLRDGGADADAGVVASLKGQRLALAAEALEHQLYWAGPTNPAPTQGFRISRTTS